MSEKSWRDAYALRGKVIQMQGDAAKASIPNASDIANASFQDSIKQTSSASSRPETLKQPDYVSSKDQEKQLKDDAYREGIEKGGFEGFMSSVGQAVDKPFIKQALNAISTGTYATANAAQDMIEGQREVRDGLKDGNFDLGKVIKGVTEVSLAPLTGTAKGISAGIGQNANDAVTFGKVIKDVQEKDLGITADPSEAGGGVAGAVQGWGGLAGDILLDPLTYATLGVVPLVKGFTSGAREGGKAAKAIAQKAVEDAAAKGTSVAPKIEGIAANESGRIMTGIRESKAEYANWNKKRADQAMQRAEIKARKKEAAGSAKGLTTGNRALIANTDANIATRQAEEAELALNDALEAAGMRAPEFEAAPKVAEEVVNDLPVVVNEKVDLLPETKPIMEPVTDPLTSVVEARGLREKINKLNDQLIKPKYGTVAQRQAFTASPTTTVEKGTGKFEDYEVSPAVERIATDVTPRTISTEAIFGKPISTDTMDEFIDFDRLIDTITARPGMKLKKSIISKHPTTGKPVEVFRGGTAKDLNDWFEIEAANADKPNTTRFKNAQENINNYLRANPGLMAEHALDPAFLAKAAQLSKKVEEVLQEGSPAVMGKREIMTKEVGPNPAAYNSSMADILKIEARDAGKTPEELATMVTSMNSRDILSFINQKANATFIADLREVLNLPNASKAELGKAFIAERKKMVDELKTEPKAKVTREEEILGEGNATPEAIAKIQEDTAKVIEDVTNSPAAFDEIAQQSARNADLQRALDNAASGMPKLKQAVPDNFVANVAHKAVKEAIERQLKDAPFRTGNKGHNTLTESPKDGGAWKPVEWSSNSQLALHTSIIKDIAGVTSLPVLKRRLYMNSLAIADKELRAAGVEPFLSHVTDAKGVVNLSLYDVLKAVEDVDGGVLQEFLFSGNYKGFNPTQFQGAAENLLHMRATGKTEEEIFRRLVSNFTKNQHLVGRPAGNELKPEAVAGKITEVKSRALKDPKATDGAAASYIVSQAENLAQAFMRAETYQALSIRSVINHAMHNSIVGKRVDDLSNDVIARLEELKVTGSPGEALELFTKAEKNLSKAFSPDDIEKARMGFAAKLASVIQNVERKAVKTAEVRTKVSDPKPNVIAEALDANTKARVSGRKPKTTPVENAAKVQAVTNKTHVSDAKAVTVDVLESAPRPKPADELSPEIYGAEPFEMIGAEISSAAMRKIHPIQALVNPRLGLDAGTYRAINSGLHSIARQQNAFHGTLLNHMATRGHQALSDDFGKIQTLSREHLAKADGTAFKLPEDVGDSTREMYEIMSTLFDTSLSNVYARNGIGALHFNSHLDAAHLSKDWRFDPDASKDVNAQAWTQWEGIEKSGVMDFMSKVHTASVKASQDISIAASFSKEFGVAAYTPGKNLVKLAWSGKRKPDELGSLYDLIDKTLYYPKDIAVQVRQLDRLLSESRSLNTSTPVGKFFVNVFDPVTNALKASQTTVRPGHWAISFAGDLLRNHLAGVNSIVPYQHAVGIMKAGKFDMEDFMGDIVSTGTHNKAVAEYAQQSGRNVGFDLAEAPVVSGKQRTGVHMIIGGKKVNVTYADMNSILNDGVIIPKHRGGGGAVEDRFIGENITNKLSKKLEKATDFVTDNKHFSLNEWAAKRDNLMRISMAVDMASKRTWKNVDEMKAAMEEYVTKWAPLSTDFTAFEAKYARRTLLYYTWLRGITPRVVDAAMTKPGIATIIPKAQFNLALANGIHPESFGNPFDPDTAYPEYYSKNILGPQWLHENGQWGLNPSSPVVEVANTFAGLNPAHPIESAGDMGKMLLGMSSPFFKAPVELSTKTQLQNGIPIESRTQYALDNFGGSYVAAASRATGKTLGEGGIVDRTDSAHKETPEDQKKHAMLQFMNFMTGAKLTDYQSTGAQKSAAYSIKEDAKKQAERNK